MIAFAVSALLVIALALATARAQFTPIASLADEDRHNLARVAGVCDAQRAH